MVIAISFYLTFYTTHLIAEVTCFFQANSSIFHLTMAIILANGHITHFAYDQLQPAFSLKGSVSLFRS